MAKVDKWVTARKAAETFLKYAVATGVALSTVELPDGELSDKALVSVGLGAVFAVARAINNVRKRSKVPVGFRSASGYLLAVAGLAGLLAGCITTTSADGTTTTQLDPVALETAWSTWERYEARKALLEREKAAAQAARDAQRVAIIEAELDKLEPKINELADRLGLTGE